MQSLTIPAAESLTILIIVSKALYIKIIFTLACKVDPCTHTWELNSRISKQAVLRVERIQKLSCMYKERCKLLTSTNNFQINLDNQISNQIESY